ncbi:MAG: serpin family protein [Bacteroidales bacterium]|nr:serpin family protein [Bacteroidales bacterium]
MKKIILIFAALAALLCSCCAQRKAHSKTVENAKTIEVKTVATKTAAAPSDYVFGLFGRVAGQEDVFVSPLSLSLALAMTATGAEGETYGQMVSTLGLGGMDRRALYESFEKLTSTLESADTSVTMETANSIWVHEGLPVKPAFEKGARKHFGAEIGNVDFNQPAAAQKINSWCCEKTHGKICQVVERTPGWKMALVNAVYFKAAWEEAFTRTEEGVFNGLGGKKSDVNYLLKKGFMEYAEDADFQMVELPYGERGRFVLDVILPKADFDKAPAMNQVRFDTLAAALESRRVNFKMPEFKMESTINLADILAEMGMPKAFSPAAELGGISDVPLMIDNVLQKTFIDLNKEGTEAAAVTVISVRLTSVGPGYEQPYINFIADRPFLFVIRERQSGAIMFLGQKVK